MDLGAEKEEEETGKLEEAEEMVAVEMLVVSSTEEQLLSSTLLLLLFLFRTMLRVVRIPLRFLPHLLFKVLQAETTGSRVGVRGSLR